VGVLPLEFLPGQSKDTLGLNGHEVYDIEGLSNDIQPGQLVTVRARDEAGNEKVFQVKVRLDTPIEVEYYRHGGILQYVLRNMVRNG